MQPGEQRFSISNMARFLASNPSAVTVLARKVMKRLRNEGHADERGNNAWIARHATDPADIASPLDGKLWEDALAFGEETRRRAAPILAAVPFDMGGGGDYEFLYWLTRYFKPTTIVETGVSAGWTSQAFLSALAANGRGKLYSSDFPYFRVRDPERYIGVIVDPALKSDWTLHTTGDENALPRIFAESAPVDLFHYDSDKSYSGRDFAVGLAMDHLAPNGLILVDDICNDSWFREYVERTGVPFTVLHGRCGLIDPSNRLI